MEELVDIILATYQTNIKYLTEQIDSILGQTYRNIHLIISDDKSPNKEIQKILKQYKEKDERVTIYIQEKNLGYIKNFEFLLQKSEAKYIMFADHDDIWYPDKVKKSLETLKQNSVDLVYCNSTQINQDGKIIQKNYFKYKNVPLINGKHNLAISRCIGIGCSQIITKQVRDKMIPLKNEVMAHDWLAAFIANEGEGITYIEEPLFGYRLHDTNVFGGRSLDQNLKIWKEKNGTNYKSYLNYRKENVIDKAYLKGVKMCKAYTNKEENINYIEKMIKYYENLEKSKYINFHWISYLKFLKGKNLGKKMLKEFIIFHIPVIGFLYYKK